MRGGIAEEREVQVAEAQVGRQERPEPVAEAAHERRRLPGGVSPIAKNAPVALKAGARVTATLKATTGPKSAVTGDSTTPSARIEVLARRFTPAGVY